MTISFDKKLAELDAYLQMLIEQGEELDKKINDTGVETEREGLVLIKNNLESLLSSIKHAIVLLQIAKVSIKTSTEPSSTSASSTPPFIHRTASRLSVNVTTNAKAAGTSSKNIQQTTTYNEDSYTKSSTVTSSSVDSSTSSSASDSNSCSTTAAIAASLQEQQRQLADRFAVGSSNCGSNTNCRNYADDDDTFYDAAEETPKLVSEPNIKHSIAHKEEKEDERRIRIESEAESTSELSDTTQAAAMSNTNTISTTNNNNNNNISCLEDVSIDWDALYDEEEEDLGSLENQGSVIKHLISQIRIGMDLTKVVLPTFILERRSLLEMYADFFAHPDLFSSIPDYETPEERMVHTVRWYLSAFHAGRKSSVAKKPYNPILGEIFLCHWSLDHNLDSAKPKADQSQVPNESIAKNLQTERTNSTESTSSTSDIEIFSKQLPKNSLLFVAEQVSHHPPVSAFYAENTDKQISCCAHIYTRSKYLGLSVGVHNVGQGVINVLKHNETYVCTFPSAYGRSILTVPWVELGGTVNIVCEQTGYTANIEFVTKPFYGGKKHRVVGEILRPNGEPFMSIDGEWNGCMYFKEPHNSNDKQVFVDTTCLPVIKKNVRSVSSQETFESRNVWKEVTRALKLHDVTSATTAKSFIEQRQRDLLKDRMEKGIKWKTRYFETVEDGWTYTKPLAERLSKAK